MGNLKAVKTYILAIVCMMFLVAWSGYAQQTTGSILGTVKDQTGAVVNTATVRATNVDTGFSRAVPTNGLGEYRIDNLPVGTYTLAATAGGFKRFVQENLDLSVDQNLTIDVAISAGAVSETITVTEAPPVINTTDAGLGQTVEADQIISLPLVNRNVYSELSLVPGVMANSASTVNGGGSNNPNFQVGLASEDVQINGGLDSGNGTVAFYLDGGNNITGMRNYGNQSPNPDALQEFRVETNAYSAQYGQFSGGVVTVLTKSGTNKFHGSLFEFNRNTDFNAWNWVVTPNPIAGLPPVKPPYHRNNFGGTVGGTIKHDKAFFFGSYAGLRQVQGTSVTGGVVPTAAERAGDFTADTFPVYNPKPTATPAASWFLTPQTVFTANPGVAQPCIPGSAGNNNQTCGTNTSTNCLTPHLNCLNATAVAGTAYLDPTAINFNNVNNTIGVFIPLPNGALVPSSGGGKWVGQYTQPTTTDEFLGKYDENIGDKDRLSVTYYYNKSKSTPSGGGNVLWTGVQSASAQTNAIIAEVHNFSPNTANQGWITFTRAMGGRVLLPVVGPASQTLASFGSNFLIDGPNGLPQLTGAGFNTGNPNAGPVTGSDNYELRDVVTLNKGKHNLSLGGEFGLDKTMFLANLNNYGEITFAASAPTSTDNPMSDYIAGQTSGFEQDAPYVTHLSTWHTALFAQDNYRLTPRFTANLGIRWDIDTPPVDAHDRMASFIPLQQSTVIPTAPLGQVFVGDAGISRGVISTQYRHISPRVGFAWDPFGDGKTSVRGAGGMFFGTPSGNEWNQPGNAMPFSIRNNFGATPSLTNVYGGPAYNFPSTARGGGIFPYNYSPSNPQFYPNQGIEAISPNAKYTTVYQFNTSVQQELPFKISMTVAYVGTLGRHIQFFTDANYAPYSTAFGAPGTGAASIDQRRQYDGKTPGAAGSLSGITYLITDQTSNYHALQVSATKTMSHGFSLSGFYVWSRALESANPVENGLSSAQDFGVFGKPFTLTNTPGNPALGVTGGGLGEEYGPMDQNRTHNAAIYGLWNISYYHGSNRIVKGVVNGWQFSPVVYLMSGQPFTVSTGSNKNLDSAGASRPNKVPGVSAHLDPHRCRACATGVTKTWFNNAAFSANGPGLGIGPGGADGNSGRDNLTGPGLKDMDAGLFRNVNFPWGVVFQFRVEVTNVMNWVNLAQPSSGNITSGTQASITNTCTNCTQRIIQLGGRLTF